MDVTRRRVASSEHIQGLTGANAALQAKNAQLERTNADLKAANDNLELKWVAPEVRLGLSCGLV